MGGGHVGFKLFLLSVAVEAEKEMMTVTTFKTVSLYRLNHAPATFIWFTLYILLWLDVQVHLMICLMPPYMIIL